MTALRTLFLHPPSFEGFDGGAGSRYQARREIRSFWYPTWLAQPAAWSRGAGSWTRRPTASRVEEVAPLARRVRPGRAPHQHAVLRQRRARRRAR